MSVLARLASFYQSPLVRERILEYCGAVSASPSKPTAWGIAGFGGRRRLSEQDGGPVPCSKDSLTRLMADGADIARSMGDDRGNLMVLDVDYVNPADPAAPYRDPETVFERIEPVYRALRALFSEYGLRPLALITGQGYHFVLRIASSSPLHRAVGNIGHVGYPLRTKYESRRRWRREMPRFGRTHDGIGRLLESVCHRAIGRLRGVTDVPVKLADVKIGGEPFVCLDLSAYGDPLYERYVRCAFSGNQKAAMSGSHGGDGLSICLPRGRCGFPTLLEARRDPVRAAAMAQRSRARIPVASQRGLSNWIDDYRESELASFHRFFDEGWHDEPESWHTTYDRLRLETLPPAVHNPLAEPNPALLKPENMRAIALYFWREEGWHPRAVAGLLRSKFERDFGWGDYWFRYDAAQRADFYVRVLCGAAAGAVDPDLLAAGAAGTVHRDVPPPMVSRRPPTPFVSP